MNFIDSVPSYWEVPFSETQISLGYWMTVLKSNIPIFGRNMDGIHEIWDWGPNSLCILAQSFQCRQGEDNREGRTLVINAGVRKSVDHLCDSASKCPLSRLQVAFLNVNIRTERGMKVAPCPVEVNHELHLGGRALLLEYNKVHGGLAERNFHAPGGGDGEDDELCGHYSCRRNIGGHGSERSSGGRQPPLPPGTLWSGSSQSQWHN